MPEMNLVNFEDYEIAETAFGETRKAAGGKRLVIGYWDGPAYGAEASARIDFETKNGKKGSLEIFKQEGIWREGGVWHRDFCLRCERSTDLCGVYRRRERELAKEVLKHRTVRLKASLCLRPLWRERHEI